MRILSLFTLELVSWVSTCIGWAVPGRPELGYTTARSEQQSTWELRVIVLFAA